MKTMLTAAVVLYCAIANTAWSGPGGAEVIRLPFRALDTGTDPQHKTPDEQVKMLKDLGYDGIGPGVGADSTKPTMWAALDKYDLKMTGLYQAVRLDATPPPTAESFRPVLEILKGRGTILMLAIVRVDSLKPSSPEGDDKVVALLRPLADLADEYGVRIALYPHINNWVERVDDAVRVARKADRKNLGVMFNLCHWLAVDGRDLEATLKPAMPWLFAVTINGATVGEGKGWDKLIQPLGQGSYDVSRIVRTLVRLGYRGPVGLQLFGVKGDAEGNLRRSIEAWRTMTKNLGASAAGAN
ncbi:MAG: sugar phosphate isomerase/epimerase [bacterium]|nr:sugar phosphate isomerase/epimerase [bacterium]